MTAIAEHAAGLEQMGMLFNNAWKAARDELLARDEPRVSFLTFSGICAAHGLSQLDADTLVHLMHDLGYIVHYSEDENQHDAVVLKPQWLTKSIGFVLEDRAAERSGILALHRLLNELDPNQEKLGLHRVATYTGDFRWLCKQHYDAYQPNIPDVIQ